MPNPALATYRDGDLSSLHLHDGPWEETFEGWPGLVLWHIPYTIDNEDYSLPDSGSFEAPFGYLWKDTSRRWIGDNLIQFERLRYNIPGDQNRPVGITKNYQAGQYTFANGGIAALSISAFSRAIKANCAYHYAHDDPGSLPVLPFIHIIPFLSGQLITDVGTGFPHATFNPPTGGSFSLPSNNFGSSFISGSIDHVFGRLFCRKVITG